MKELVREQMVTPSNSSIAEDLLNAVNEILKKSGLSIEVEEVDDPDEEGVLKITLWRELQFSGGF